MGERTANLGTTPRRRWAIGAAMLLTIVGADRARPQPVSPPPSPAVPQQEPAPSREAAPPKENPGLIDEIGKLLPTLKSPRETIDEAADALSRLTKSPGVKGRAICPAAPNGAPDCKAAADKLCQGKGFRQGSSLDVDTTRNCSVSSLLLGRKPDESECRTETWVTRALCQ